MASASQAKLEAAIGSVITAYERLETAALSASLKSDGVQADQIAQYEAVLTEAVSENTFLKEDNLRLSNQLQALQEEYLDLQKAATGAVSRLDASVKQIDLLLEH